MINQQNYKGTQKSIINFLTQSLPLQKSQYFTQQDSISLPSLQLTNSKIQLNEFQYISSVNQKEDQNPYQLRKINMNVQKRIPMQLANFDECQKQKKTPKNKIFKEQIPLITSRTRQQLQKYLEDEKEHVESSNRQKERKFQGRSVKKILFIDFQTRKSLINELVAESKANVLYSKQKEQKLVGISLRSSFKYQDRFQNSEVKIHPQSLNQDKITTNQIYSDKLWKHIDSEKEISQWRIQTMDCFPEEYDFI